MIDYIWRINNFDVFYTNETNGGGDFFYIEYADVIKNWYNKETFDSTLEWCSGPGFIGFGLYAEGLTRNISLLDKYKPAVDIMYKTKSTNDDIKIYHGDNLGVIPETETFDLVVGNPPHWKNKEDATKSLPHSQFDNHLTDILIDEDWKAHADFFKKIKTRLSQDGKILLQENNTGSNPRDFQKVMDESGLRISNIGNSRMYPNIYYMEIVHAE